MFLHRLNNSRTLKATFLGLGLATAIGVHSAPSANSINDASEGASKQAPNAAQALPNISGVVQANRAAVVNISTTRKVGGGRRIPEQFEGTPFEEFFRRFFDRRGQKERKVHSLGSGFIVSSTGHIVTNAHVVKDTSQVVVQLADRRQLDAEILGQDRATDIAVLKVDAKDLPTVQWHNGEGPEVGEWVLAVGSPFGFEQSVTAGIVSAKGRSIPTSRETGNYVPFLQTDVAINPGSSGGPLFNLDGEVVGINAQIYSKSGGYMGLSFAIPSAVAQGVVADIRAGSEVSHGYLGVSLQNMNRELARSLGLDKPRGGLIAEVKPGTPADKAGLKAGDIILEVEGHTITQVDDLPPLIGGLDPGTEVTLTLLRDKERLKKTVTLGALKEARGRDTEASEPTSALGMELGPVPNRLRKERPLPESGGALVRGVQEGAAQQAGIRPGDVLLKLGDFHIDGPGEARELLAGVYSGKRIPVLVQRGERRLFLPLQAP